MNTVEQIGLVFVQKPIVQESSTVQHPKSKTVSVLQPTNSPRQIKILLLLLFCFCTQLAGFVATEALDKKIDTDVINDKAKNRRHNNSLSEN
mmetsp:Transcript_17690/g.43124  ORF Transcript_17690/g.43124 Transcript_17690/m.43124 type:complete len:92 (-) Transcript_17690:477-752(-)